MSSVGQSEYIAFCVRCLCIQSSFSVKHNVPHVYPAHLPQLPLAMLLINYIWYTADIWQNTLGMYANFSVQYIP